MIRFFKELRRHVKGKIILLWDRLPAPRPQKVQAYLDTQKHWLTVTWFPGYAAELNPVESMWSVATAKDWKIFMSRAWRMLMITSAKAGDGSDEVLI